MKKSRLIIIIFIICLIILIGAIYLFEKKQQASDYQNNIEEFQSFRKEFEDETILARNPTVIYKYEGEYENEDLFRNMKKFSDYMYYLKDNVNSQNASQYYNQNIEIVKEYLGITEENEFTDFINKLEQIDVSSEKFKYAEFVKNSTYTKNGYFIFRINFYYDNGSDDPITFKVNWALKKNTDIGFKYSFAN